jgi:hypothetical protein
MCRTPDQRRRDHPPPLRVVNRGSCRWARRLEKDAIGHLTIMLREHVHGYSPTAIRSLRRSIRWEAFIANTATVARPVGVCPRIRAARSSKCSLQRCCLGLKSGTIWPLSGSMPAMLGPLCRLQKTQTGYTRSFPLSILYAAPHNRGSGAPEAGRLEPASPGTGPPRRIIMRHATSRPAPPRAR